MFFKVFLITLLSLTTSFLCYSQNEKGPILLPDGTIQYNEKIIQPGPHTFYIDGSLSPQDCKKHQFIFNTLQAALPFLSDGTATSPMIIYFAPWVYWIDDPDDPSIRTPRSGSVPYGMEIKCEWLQLKGLCTDPKKVILAANRGQTMGAKGNFTLFHITGNNFSIENLTVGNYCNIDLNYPWNPKLNREKRGKAIVQAQLIISDGDRLAAKNSRFISRLNLCPMGGGKRVFFDHCHFECTDDALNSNAVYLNCTFDFYSGKPFWGTSGTGAVLINCRITSYTHGKQYFTKTGGQLSLINTQLISASANYIGWQDHPSLSTRNYEYQNKFNAIPLKIDSLHSYATVDLNNKAALKAFVIITKTDTFYNSYNLTKGDDDWDPANTKSKIIQLEDSLGTSLTNLPIRLTINDSQKGILETGKDTASLSVSYFRFGNYPTSGDSVTWTIRKGDEKWVRIIPLSNNHCLLIPNNTTNYSQTIVLIAHSPSGLEAAKEFKIVPPILPAPKLKKELKLCMHQTTLEIRYQLTSSYPDDSKISWYRSKNNNPDQAIQVAVSRRKPLKYYPLTTVDNGWYIMAKINPKTIRSNSGESHWISTQMPIKIKKSVTNLLEIKLQNFPTEWQTQVKRGFWTVDAFKPKDTGEYQWTVDSTKNPWYYGTGIYGAAKDTGLVQNQKGARLRYTPLLQTSNTMTADLIIVPCKTAGQGFSSARAQYMDIGIKFDTKRLNGYALRLIRTIRNDHAIDFQLMQYKEGFAHPIGKSVSSSCFKGHCHIRINITDSLLTADAQNEQGAKTAVHLKSSVDQSVNNGFLLQHTGSVGSGACVIKKLTLSW